MSKKYQIGTTSFKALVTAIFNGETMADDKANEPHGAMTENERQVGTVTDHTIRQFFMFADMCNKEAVRVHNEHNKLHECEARNMIDSEDCKMAANKVALLLADAKALVKIFWAGVNQQFPEAANTQSGLMVRAGWIVVVNKENEVDSLMPESLLKDPLYQRIKRAFTNPEQKVEHEPEEPHDDSDEVMARITDPVAKSLFSLSTEMKTMAREALAPKPKGAIRNTKEFMKEYGGLSLNEIRERGERHSLLSAFDDYVVHVFWSVVRSEYAVTESAIELKKGWKVVKSKDEDENPELSKLIGFLVRSDED